MEYAPRKDYKVVTTELKAIYQYTTEKEALLALEKFSEKGDAKSPQISRSWYAHRYNLNALFSYPEDIEKAIYTTKAIELLTSVIRKAIKKRNLFPTHGSARKVIIFWIISYPVLNFRIFWKLLLELTINRF